MAEHGNRPIFSTEFGKIVYKSSLVRIKLIIVFSHIFSNRTYHPLHLCFENDKISENES